MSRIAVTGASGYIGGRLVPLLLEQGHEVTVLTRNAQRLRDVPFASQVRIVEGPLEDEAAVAELCRGTDTVYYLAHSMTGHRHFAELERNCARTLATAARGAAVRQLVYLSGLHPQGQLSEHLSSRVEVGRILQASGVPALVLQAGLVIGSGSASFEMVRHVADVLPVMPAPRWVLNKVQPIAVRDALYYLARAAQLDEPVNATYDIGGPQAHSYAELMKIYAAVAGQREPVVLALPLLTPKLASHWVNLVTPLPHTLSSALVDSLQHDCVVHSRAIDQLIAPPPEGLRSYRQAVQLALAKIEADAVETTWATAQPVRSPDATLPSDPQWAGRTAYVDQRSTTSTVDAQALFDAVQGVGGQAGYLSWMWLWKLRGAMDKLGGGVGMRRGRRSAARLALGDVVDWWRVEALEPGRLLRLKAEMKMPGSGWLEFTVEPQDGGGSKLVQKAVFLPRGLAGRAYWWAVAPFHALVLPGLLRGLARQAERG